MSCLSLSFNLFYSFFYGRMVLCILQSIVPMDHELVHGNIWSCREVGKILRGAQVETHPVFHEEYVMPPILYETVM